MNFTTSIQIRGNKIKENKSEAQTGYWAGPVTRGLRMDPARARADSRDPRVGNTETGEESRRTPVSSSSSTTASPAK
jgi:hypothetical protein